jgi:hypothetical protein
MKKFLFYIALTCIPLASMAQTDSVKTSRWTIGTSTTILKSSYRWKATNADGARYEFSSPYNLRIGLETNFALNEKWTLTGGLSYSKRDYSELYQCDNCASLNLNANTIRLRYVDIPISAGYQLKPGRFNVHATAGITTSFLAQAWRTYHYSDERVSQTFEANDSYQQVLLSGEVGFRANFKFTDSWSINARASYETPLYEPTIDYELMWSTFQAAFGFTYHF